MSETDGNVVMRVVRLRPKNDLRVALEHALAA